LDSVGAALVPAEAVKLTAETAVKASAVIRQTINILFNILILKPPMLSN
jgi:hypothetical protein